MCRFAGLILHDFTQIHRQRKSRLPPSLCRMWPLQFGEAMETHRWPAPPMRPGVSVFVRHWWHALSEILKMREICKTGCNGFDSLFWVRLALLQVRLMLSRVRFGEVSFWHDTSCMQIDPFDSILEILERTFFIGNLAEQGFLEWSQ